MAELYMCSMLFAFVGQGASNMAEDGVHEKRGCENKATGSEVISDLWLYRYMRLSVMYESLSV